VVVGKLTYSNELVQRLGIVLQDRTDVIEKRMFGGVTFMVSGHMCCGVTGEDLMVRVGPEQYGNGGLLPHARPMDFTGRAMKGFVFVESAGIDSDEDLEQWVSRGIKFVSTLPPK